MRRQSGFVLLYALVVAGALSAVAVHVLERAETARARRALTQQTAQMDRYLDGLETLALSVLAADRAAGATDHLREPWARADWDEAVDRGRVAGRIVDLQGRFNLNRLSVPGDAAARAAWDRLAVRIGIAPSSAAAVAAFLSPDPPGPARGGIRPPGGAVSVLEQLRAVPRLRPEEYERLARHAAALPADAPLNVNTASASVLASLVPGLSEGAAETVLRARPFATVDAFADRLADAIGPDGRAALDPGRFTVASRHFELTAAARLDTPQEATLGRISRILRPAAPAAPRVAQRVRLPQ